MLAKIHKILPSVINSSRQHLLSTTNRPPPIKWSQSPGQDLLEAFVGKRVIVNGYDDKCFRINDVVVNQSVILLPHSMFLWNVREAKDITIESLSIFPLIFPTIEILFVGCGETLEKPFSKEITQHFREKGIIIEACGSVNAASTFNVLTTEGRNVAAALLTIKPTLPLPIL